MATETQINEASDTTPLWRDSDRRMRDDIVLLELADALPCRPQMRGVLVLVPYITVEMSRGLSVLIDDDSETVAVSPEHLPALIATLQEVQRRIEEGDVK